MGSCTFDANVLTQNLIYNCIVVDIIRMCSGITRGRVLNGEL